MSRSIHFEILSEDPEKTAAFYRDALGWEVSTWDAPQAFWLATTGAEGTPGIDGAFMSKEFDQTVINTVHTDDLAGTTAQSKKPATKQSTAPTKSPALAHIPTSRIPTALFLACCSQNPNS